MMKKHYLIAAGLGLGMLTACGGEKQQENQDTEVHGLRVEYMDTTVSPREDFFMFVNGSYVKNTEVPEEKGIWGMFHELRDGNLTLLREVMEEASAGKAAGDAKVNQMIGNYWTAAMDTAGIEAKGIAAIQPQIDMINHAADKQQLADVFADFHQHTVFPGFVVWAGQDAKNSERYIASFWQGGMGMPDPGYYLSNGGGKPEIREKYKAFISDIFIAAGRDVATASAAADKIMEMEIDFASSAMNIVERRDPNNVYHLYTIDKLEKDAPGFPWKSYFTKTGLQADTEFNVGMPDFVKNFASEFQNRPLDDWKLYTEFTLLRTMSPFLNEKFAMASFNFYDKTLQGSEKPEARWKQVVDQANGDMGELLGQAYVEKAFSPEAKEKALEMIGNILDVMRERLATLEWMTPETRAKAREKVDAIAVKIGYPDKWRDYSGMNIVADNYAQNVLEAGKYNYAYMMSRIGKPIDRSQWMIPPQTVNAYYNPSMNEIVFPAGILQPPFFDAKADDPVNYGGIGMVIGHELIHAFDDQGSKYDAKGNLNNWWTDEDRSNFEQRAMKVVQQYNNYTVLDSLHVNGMLTLGENMADIDGLRIAYYAMKKAMEGKDMNAKIQGYTPEQRFFISHGQVWCTVMKDAYLNQMINTNPHSPAKYRVIGPASNLEEFYTAFAVQEGDGMYRPDSVRVQIW